MSISIDTLSDPHLASRKYKNIREEIKDFEANLDTDHEIAIQLASFGSPVLMAVHSIGYMNPDVLRFYGNVDGKRVQLIQHMSQLNLLLMAVEKTNPNVPARRIGFQTDDVN